VVKNNHGDTDLPADRQGAQRKTEASGRPTRDHFQLQLFIFSPTKETHHRLKQQLQFVSAIETYHPQLLTKGRGSAFFCDFIRAKAVSNKVIFDVTNRCKE